MRVNFIISSHLRIDTIGQMLTYGNVHCNCNVVVMETAQGLLLGSVLERLGGEGGEGGRHFKGKKINIIMINFLCVHIGYGKLVHVYFGDLPVHIALDNCSHLSQQDRSILLQYSLHKLGTIHQYGERYV